MSKFRSPREFCEYHGACSGGKVFAYHFSSLDDVWDVCHRADWMLWMYEKAIKRLCMYTKSIKRRDPRALRLFACWCVEETPGVPKLTDPRSIEAIRVAKLYANGEATDEQLRMARKNASYAIIDSPLTNAAEVTTRLGSWYAAYKAVGYTTRSLVENRDIAHQAQADALRKFIPNPFKE